MPLSTGTTYTHLVGAMKAAYDISAAMPSPDVELDLQDAAEPHFGNHSLRRHADRNTREWMQETGVSKQLIDCFFGWLLKAMMLDMQLRYAGLDRPGRRALSKVTMML